MMPKTQKVVACVLGAGQSVRFGECDKLLYEINGLPMIAHVARQLSGAGFRYIAAITQKKAPDIRRVLGADIDHVINHDPEAGQSHSMRLAVDYAEQCGADAMVLALGDMPFVTAAHFKRLRMAAHNYDIVLSQAGNNIGPPALFGREIFDALKHMQGDNGAKSIVRRLGFSTIKASEEALRDIDRPDDLM